MIKIYLNRIIDSYSLKKENVQIAKIRELALRKGANIDKIPKSKLNMSSAEFLDKKATDIIRVNQIQYETDLEKQLFKTSYVFYDNEDFLDVLKKYDIKFDTIKKTFDSLSFEKSKGKEAVGIESPRIEKLKRYYGLKRVETIINKIGEIAYLEPELVEEKQKVKKLA